MRSSLALLILAIAIVTPTRSPAATTGEAPRRATADDIALFAPYIGTFRSRDHKFDDGKTEYHFTIRYAWFDRNRTIVKFTVSTVIPSQSRVIVNSEGFYGYDPRNRQLYVFGAFTSGITGWGTIGEFDRNARTHAVWATSTEVTGAVTHVRDAFEVIDANSWRNRTSIREGDSGAWKVVHEGVYTRVAE